MAAAKFVIEANDVFRAFIAKGERGKRRNAQDAAKDVPPDNPWIIPDSLGMTVIQITIQRSPSDQL
jgi:hypothetical protein